MQLQGELDLALIWLETNPPNVIYMEMRSLSRPPRAFLSASARTREGTGIGEGGKRQAQLLQQ